MPASLEEYEPNGTKKQAEIAHNGHSIISESEQGNHATNTPSFKALISVTQAIGIMQPKPLRRNAEAISAAGISRPGFR